MRFTVTVLACAVIAAASQAQAADAPAPSDKDKARAQINQDKAALQAIQKYVGGWRGVGLIDRSRNDGAWGESAQWAWSFDGGRAAIVFDAADGKYYKAGKILPGAKADEFTFTGTLPDGKTTETFTGKFSDGQLVLDADKAPAAGSDRPAQITMRTVAKGDRLLVLYQKKNGNQFARMGEVGYTRKGSGFGQTAKDNECVVTGGEGDIKVEYKGKAYYVCCRGCLIEFNENPDKVMAEFFARKTEEARKKKEE